MDVTVGKSTNEQQHQNKIHANLKTNEQHHQNKIHWKHDEIFTSNPI